MAGYPYPQSLLDGNQVLQFAFDDATQRLRVDATATIITPPAIDVVISHLNDSIRLGDGTNYLTSTTVGPKVALDAYVVNNITGSFTQSGLRTDRRVTTLLITDVAQALPPTPLPGRNAMSVAVLSTQETLYIGEPSVTADRVVGTTSGWEVGPLEGFSTDITDAVAIYGRAETGKSFLVKILELA